MAAEAAPAQGPHLRDDDLVVAIITAHAPALLRTARRYSSSADDAQDAYQRALEIFVRRAGRLRRETAVGWLHQVVKHEALAVREARGRLVAVDELPEHDGGPTPEDRVVSLDRTARAAEALSRLKPQEVTALWLKAQGLSYDEIARRQEWTYTKVNRCLTEGRRAFLERFAGIESGEECERWRPALSALVDGETSMRERMEVRKHLRHCAGCRTTVRELYTSGPAVAALLPMAVGPDGVPEPAGFLTRAYEVFHAVHDRFAGAQAVAETVSAHKVSAVAAASVALAGGGALGVERTGVLQERERDRHAARADAPPRREAVATRARAAAVRAGARAGTVARVAAAAAPASRAGTPRPATTRTRRQAREFGFEGGAPAVSSPPRQTFTASAASTSTPAPAPRRRAPAPTTNASPEFGFEAP